MKFNEDTDEMELTEEEYYTFVDTAKKHGTTVDEELNNYLDWNFAKFEALDLTKDDVEMFLLLMEKCQK